MPDYDDIYESFRRGNLRPFYANIFPSLLRYARKLTGEQLSYLAKDCVQDAIFQCYMRRDSYASMSHWRNALFISIRNRVIDLIRKAECDHNYMESVLLGRDEDEDVSLAMIYQDVLEVIYAAVDTLPEKYRELFRLSFVQGLKNTEIAEILSVAEITVKKRKARLIEKIRQILGRDIDTYLVLFLMAA